MLALTLALTLALPTSTDSLARIPGTALHLGWPLTALDSSSAFKRTTVSDAAGLAVRSGPCRFFGLETQATLNFSAGRLVRASFTADSLSPHSSSFVEDELVRLGYHRTCVSQVPGDRVCDWSGATRLHLELHHTRLTAQVENAGLRDTVHMAALVAAAAPETARVAASQAPDRSMKAARPETLNVTTAGIDTLAPPRTLVQPEPHYPSGVTGVFGRVRVRALVDTSGAVMDAQVVRSIRELDAAALECARGYRFAPCLFHGRPARFFTEIEIAFIRHGPSSLPHDPR